MKYQILNNNGIVFFKTDDRDKALEVAKLITAKTLLLQRIDESNNEIEYNAYCIYLGDNERTVISELVKNPSDPEYDNDVYRFNFFDLKNPSFVGFNKNDTDEYAKLANEYIEEILDITYKDWGICRETNEQLQTEPCNVRDTINVREVKRFRFNINVLVAFASGFLSAILLNALW